MDKIFEFFYSTVENEDYSKAMEIGLVLLMLFAPSISVIFLYKRELFMSMDFTKLLLIGVLMNIVLFVITYTVLKMFTTLELILETYDYIELGNEITELREELNKIEEDSEEIQQYKQKTENNYERYNSLPKPVQTHNIRMVRLAKEYIVVFTILIWLFYVWDYIVKSNVTDDFAIKRITLYIIGGCTVHIVKMILGIKGYIKSMKTLFNAVTGKQYIYYKDRNIIATLGIAIFFSITLVFLFYGCIK